MDGIQTSRTVSGSIHEDANIDEFFNAKRLSTIYLNGGERSKILIEYIPLLNVRKNCFVILKNTQIGEFISQIVANGTLPQPGGTG